MHPQLITDNDLLTAKIAICKNDPELFANFAYDWGHGELRESRGLRDWQKNIMRDISNHLKNPETRFTPLRIAVSSGHGIGKAHPVNMQLHTPNGLKKWGELCVGDYVFDENGNPTKIIKTEKYSDIEIYRVYFHDGTHCDVSSGHLWNVRGRQERRNKKNGWRTLSTQELINNGVKRANGIAMARQWEIPMQGAVNFSYKPVPIQPYALGAWIGDGGRNSCAIISDDMELQNRLREIGCNFNVGNKQGTKAKTLYMANIIKPLRGLGLLDKYSYQKSVPVCYMENSIEVRAEILRGLLDTDGEVGKKGTIGFNSTSKALANDVIWLVRSLGGKAQMQPTVKKPFFNDANGNKKAGLDCYRVSIQMPIGFKSFYIERKQSRVKNVEHRYLTRWINKIECIGKSDAMCITVENKTGLYQANDFIVTHNSCEVAMICNWALSTCVDTKIVITANTATQLATKTMPEVNKWFRLAINADWFKPTAESVSVTYPEHVRTWRLDAITWSENNVEAFAGLHNQGKRIVVIFDEASGISDKIWEVTEGAMTDAETEIIWLAFGNPNHNTGRFRECFGRFKHRWKTYQIDSRTVEGTNKAEFEQWVKDYGEDSDFVRVRVKGEFPRAGSMQFIPSDIVEAARKRMPAHGINDPRVMGVDVARFGDDSSVIVMRCGRDCASIPAIKLRGVDTMTLAARIVDHARIHKPDVIFVDGGGVGGGVIDRLRMLRQPVIEVQFGGSADRSQETGSGAVTYYNKRAEIWGYMKDWLKGAMIPDDPELAAELTGVQYSYATRDGKDAIQLEKKSDMKKRGVGSPDCFVAGTIISTPNGDMPIESLVEGQEVITPFGNSKIIKKWISNTDEITTSRFSNGVILAGKGKHKIFIWGAGQCRLDTLSLNIDNVSTIKQIYIWKIIQFITRGKNIQFKPLVDIIRVETNVTVLGCCTAIYGKILTEKFQKIVMFTTKMVTGVITILTILKSLIVQSTKDFICLSDMQTVNYAARQNMQYFALQNGINQPKVENGIDKNLKSNGKTHIFTQTNALYAPMNLKHTTRILNIAQPVALIIMHTVVNAITLTKGIAIGVAKNIWRIAIGQQNVVPVSVVTENVSLTKVYNLTLEKHNAYYANGILVYNCADAIAITFSYPVPESNHAKELRRSGSNSHQSSYDPLSRDYVAQDIGGKNHKSSYDDFYG